MQRILNFCLVPNHKGETIGKMVESCLLNWGMDNIFTLTVDNASSNDGAIRYLKKETMHWRDTILGHEFMHVRCCAHILNLVVKEALKDVHDSIVKIRNAVRYVRSSPARSQSFKACVEKLKIEHKGLVCLDVETRWNSKYKMLEVAEKFEKAFGRLEVDPNYVSYFDKSKNIGPPMKEDWDIARVFVKFLKLFYTVTLRFSCSVYVTSNAFFHELMALVDRLNTLMRSSDAYLSCMAIKMKKKLDKYWENDANLNFVLFAAVVLDPRFKMGYVGFCFDEVYGEYKGRLMRDGVKETLYSLYAHYESMCFGVYSSSQNSDELIVDDVEDNIVLSFQQKYSRHRKGI
ncbi:zinc finger BED domain-containing protein RICESLEEPER 2-like [Euphorbia lathyris]|uniref:zinc finger BED domain-containing protein RICESLEEPER 2-like n=1 Tax=Euphorbia lathyris TaxID=212925 RepID=UPI003313BA58